MQALNGANEPGSKAVLRPVRRPHQNDPGCLDEEHAQIAVAALGEAPEDSPVSSRHLFGHEAEPSRIIPPSRKGRSIADRGNHGARDDRADARHGHHAAPANKLARIAWTVLAQERSYEARVTKAEA